MSLGIKLCRLNDNNELEVILTNGVRVISNQWGGVMLSREDGRAWRSLEYFDPDDITGLDLEPTEL